MTDSTKKDPDESDIAKLEKQLTQGLRSGEIRSVVEFLAKTGNQLSVSDLMRLVAADLDFRKSKGESADITDYYSEIPELGSIGSDQTITKLVQHETTAAQTEVFDLKPGAPKTRKLVQVGGTIDDFELLAELGKGSFATVFLARQKSMQRLVALKVSADHDMEAQTLAQLDHPHIVRVFDQRRAKEHDLQLLYMQYLEGGTLHDVLKRIVNVPAEELSGKLFVECVDESIIERGASPNYESIARKQYLKSDWEQTICRIGYNLARALDYAHEKGVLHRDIKPANVLIGSDYSVKLADFNISAADAVIGDSKFGGSLAYMSPEQIRAFNPDDDFDADQLNHKCDIYSLGVLLYQMLTRELPFYAVTKSRSTDGLKTMIAEREHSVERVISSLQNYSQLLRNALVRCLQPTLNYRPDNARDLANQLKIGLDRDAEKFLFPARGNWTLYLQNYFYTVCIFVIFVFNFLGAIFVRNFNLVDSMPEKSQETFKFVVLVVNRIIFPTAIIIFIALTIMVPTAIKLCLARRQSEIPDLKLATHRTLAAGHIQAIICGSFWLFAGFLYPTILTILGCRLKSTDWVDFIASHTLAGIAITAMTFFATTYLALRIWLPVLIQNSFTASVVSTVTSGLNDLIRKIPIYQMCAVSVPLLAIALLVIYKELMTGSENALRVISVFGLFTIPIVMIGGNRIRSVCEKLLLVFRES